MERKRLKVGERVIVRKGKHIGKVVQITLVIEKGVRTNYFAKFHDAPVEMFFRDGDFT